jgi:hypothetical protein
VAGARSPDESLIQPDRPAASGGNPLSIKVDVFARQRVRLDLVPEIRDIAGLTETDPVTVCFELARSMANSNAERAERSL